MAQVQVTVSMDSQRQQQIERYCALSGVSRKSVFDEIMDLWERFVYIPRTEFMEKEARRRKALDAFQRQREKVARGETPELTTEEIIAEIALARAERHAKEGAK